MDVGTIIRSDHREIARLLGELQGLDRKRTRKRRSAAKQFADTFAVHIQLEEQIVYPQAERQAGAKEAVLKANEQHAILSQLLERIRSMEPSEESFDAKVAVVADLIHVHCREEERTIVRPLGDALTKDQLTELGERFEEGRDAVSSPKEYLRASDR